MTPEQVFQELLSRAERAGLVIKQASINELKQQGHINTGKSVSDIKTKLSRTATGLQLQMEMPEHLLILHFGVAASRVPFTNRSNGESDYIKGLKEWHESKAHKNPLQRAFATAIIAAEEGHPTKGSFKYSKNGRRTGWIQHVLDDGLLDSVDEILDLGGLVEVYINDIALIR